MAAGSYNLVRRALARAGAPIRFELPGLRTLELILQADAWIIVDLAFNDMPVAAWLFADGQAGRGVHEPVPCELRYYHCYAGLAVSRALPLMEELLKARLRDGGGGQIVTFSRRAPPDG